MATKSTNTKNSRTPEQQAAINKARAEARRAAAGDFTDVEAKPVNDEPLKKEFDPEQLAAELQARLADVAREFGFTSEITWERKLFAFFAAFSISFGVGTIIGKLAAWAIIGISAMGGSVLWAWLIMLLSLIISIYAGFKIGQHVGGYILSGQIDRDLAKAKDKVTSWFKRKPVEVAA